MIERRELLQPIVAGVRGGKEGSSFWRAIKERMDIHGSRKALDKEDANSFSGTQTG